MKSKVYKVLHKICGKTMVNHVLTQVEKTKMDNIITIVGYGAHDVENELGDRTEYAIQHQQLGTGNAVLQAEDKLGQLDGTTMVVSGDTPLFKASTFKKLFKYHEAKKAAVTVLTSVAPDPTGYGRVIRNNAGGVERIVEQKDADKKEQAVHEINTGVYVFDNQLLFDALHRTNNKNAQGEYYLTDVIEILKNAGKTIAAYKMSNFYESMGVNNRVALAKATKVMQKEINNRYMEKGVSMIDPEHTYIDEGAKIGQDTVIEPDVKIDANTKIGSNCLIQSGSKIFNCTIHNHVRVTSSQLQDSEMFDDSNIGPFSHLRPNAKIGKHVHLGNFVEIKKAEIGEGTKVGHLTYVGNAKLGKNINVGCGVIFANYDGKNKHTTTVGDNSFIGSNSNLIAPVEIDRDSFIAAGSTITDKVNQYDMAIARSRQTNKPGYYKKLPYRGDN
ncbi:bifunctional protein GlmU [Philodulcilactobacillus myokoensis]|uniref:Bifunctional protein GlmU n=2 Tax=Philodulcilactobacillus myokoensis TaxID=2929573 RepID=A0A9W6ET82_9LACO|nr:bifunctional protein GlmU [Philodulcilactobacillus myokoensis]